MDRGIDVGRDSGPVWDARPPVELGGPPWRPGWVPFGSWSQALWALFQLAIVASIAFLNASMREPAETVVVYVLCGLMTLTWLGGLSVLVLQPTVARRPSRPHVAAARACLIAAGVIAVSAYIGALVLSTRSVPGVVAVVAVSAALIGVLTVAARRLNDRAEAVGRLPARPANSCFAG